MGQKVSPIGLRLGIIRDWDSRWFAEKDYAELLHEDIKIRKFIYKSMGNAAIAKVEIERRAQNAKVIIHTAKPGIVIGRRGAGVESLRKNLEKLVNRPVQINVQEIKTPDLEAKLVGESIVEQIEKRISFRRAMKQAVYRCMKAGAKGIKVECSGRLAGAEIARSERLFEGRVPLHTLRADIDYAIVEAYTTYGRIGVKVWINRGEILGHNEVRKEMAEKKQAVAEQHAVKPVEEPSRVAVAEGGEA